ncbi:MAG: hypothetical protein WC157_02955 [Candidatus Paceibacterota bacterium]
MLILKIIQIIFLLALSTFTIFILAFLGFNVFGFSQNENKKFFCILYFTMFFTFISSFFLIGLNPCTFLIPLFAGFLSYKVFN